VVLNDSLPNLGQIRSFYATSASVWNIAEIAMSTPADEQLLSEMKVTKGARFNAAKRLEGRHKRMTTVTALASTSVLILTIVPAFIHATELLSAIMNIATISLSALILTFSLLQNANNDQVKSELHHVCAVDISRIRRKFRAKSTEENSFLEKYGAKYDKILKQCSVNHDDIDFYQYKLEHPLDIIVPLSSWKKFMIRTELFCIRRWHIFANFFIAILVITLTIWAVIERASHT
jgi:hypothetical protein